MSYSQHNQHLNHSQQPPEPIFTSHAALQKPQQKVKGKQYKSSYVDEKKRMSAIQSQQHLTPPLQQSQNPQPIPSRNFAHSHIVQTNQYPSNNNNIQRSTHNNNMQPISNNYQQQQEQLGNNNYVNNNQQEHVQHNTQKYSNLLDEQPVLLEKHEQEKTYSYNPPQKKSHNTTFHNHTQQHQSQVQDIPPHFTNNNTNILDDPNLQSLQNDNVNNYSHQQQPQQQEKVKHAARKTNQNIVINENKSYLSQQNDQNFNQNHNQQHYFDANTQNQQILEEDQQQQQIHHNFQDDKQDFEDRMGYSVKPKSKIYELPEHKKYDYDGVFDKDLHNTNHHRQYEFTDYEISRQQKNQLEDANYGVCQIF